MKRYLILLLFISTSYSQTNFQFDYFLEYNFTNHIDSTKSEKVFYLTNSEDNSYYVKITEKDSLNFRLLFIKQDHLYSDVKIFKKSFYKGEIINIDCNNIKALSNKYKFQAENYEMIKDTDSSNISFYKFICLRSEKYIKKNKIGFNIIKFNTKLPFHLPNLYHMTFYENWKKEKNLPNNFIIENAFYDYNKNLIWTESLINYSKTTTKINILIKECDEIYLKEIIKIKQ